MAKSAKPASGGTTTEVSGNGNGTSAGVGTDSGRFDPASGGPGPGGDTIRIDPDTATTGRTDTDTGKPRRGRPAGSTNSAKKAAAPSDIAGIEFLLMSLHTMAAEATGAKELALTPTEGHILAEALGKVQDHYGYSVSGEMMIWSNLGATFIAVYGPRAFMIRKRIMEEAAPSVQPVPQYHPPLN